MKILKRVGEVLGLLLVLPFSYLLIGLLLSLIPVNTRKGAVPSKEIYLSTNGIHLDVVIPRSYLSPDLLDGLLSEKGENYFAFGWGDKNFYINTPTWGDLTLKNALSALLWNSPSLIHLTRYRRIQEEWVAVPVTDAQLAALNANLNQGFAVAENGKKMLLPEPGYYHNDAFYAATGHYHAFRTCNSWINDLFKASGLKTSLWTPYDFGVMWWYD